MTTVFNWGGSGCSGAVQMGVICGRGAGCEGCSRSTHRQRGVQGCADWCSTSKKSAEGCSTPEPSKRMQRGAGVCGSSCTTIRQRENRTTPPHTTPPPKDQHTTTAKEGCRGVQGCAVSLLYILIRCKGYFVNKYENFCGFLKKNEKNRKKVWII